MGFLKIILGPMFSGKSTELIRVYNKYLAIHKKILLINSNLDTRYKKDNIVSHNGQNIPAKCIKSLMDMTITEEYKESEIILIDEGQFFNDVKQFVITALNDNKNIYLSGLDGDYQQKPFMEVLEIIPLANEVIKLHAFCKICGDGTNASFTKRISNSNSRILVGCHNDYISVCRKHL